MVEGRCSKYRSLGAAEECVFGIVASVTLCSCQLFLRYFKICTREKHFA